MADWLDRLTDRVSKDWLVITQAKSSFGFAAALIASAVALGTWKAAGTFYEERIATKDTIIATKDANIKYLESQIAPREKTEPLKVSDSDQEARFEVAFQYLQPTASEGLRVNVIHANKGTLPSSQPIHTHMAFYTDRVLGKADLDLIFAGMISRSRAIRGKTEVGNQVYPNQAPAFWTIFEFYDENSQPVLIDEAKLKTINDGNMRLYLFVVLQYKDRNTPSNKWRSTESCAFLYRPGSTGICDFHNSTGLID